MTRKAQPPQIVLKNGVASCVLQPPKLQADCWLGSVKTTRYARHALLFDK